MEIGGEIMISDRTPLGAAYAPMLLSTYLTTPHCQSLSIDLPTTTYIYLPTSICSLVSEQQETDPEENETDSEEADSGEVDYRPLSVSPREGSSALTRNRLTRNRLTRKRVNRLTRKGLNRLTRTEGSPACPHVPASRSEIRVGMCPSRKY